MEAKPSKGLRLSLLIEKQSFHNEMSSKYRTLEWKGLAILHLKARTNGAYIYICAMNKR